MSTHLQSVASGVLDSLKFKALPPRDEDGEMVCGGDQMFMVTPQTLRHLQSMMQLQKVVVVGSGGEITVEPDSGAGSPAVPRCRRRGA